MIRADYGFLRKEVNHFLKEKIIELEPPELDRAVNNIIFSPSGEHGTYLNKFAREIGLETDEEFFKQYITAWKQLSIGQMQEIQHYWNRFIGFPNSIRMQIEEINAYRGMHWTVVNVCELNLSGLNMFYPDFEKYINVQDEANYDHIMGMYISPDYSMPFNQCHFCSQIDTDPRGRALSAKLHFCHQSKCTSDPNPSAHEPNCCYAQWKMLKKNFREQLKRKGDDKAASIECFREFLEKRYCTNIAVKNNVRAKLEKKYEWKLLHE